MESKQEQLQKLKEKILKEYFPEKALIDKVDQLIDSVENNKDVKTSIDELKQITSEIKLEVPEKFKIDWENMPENEKVEVNIDVNELANAFSALIKDPVTEISIKNPVKKVEVSGLDKAIDLLKKIEKKETQVIVEKDKNDIKLQIPTSNDPTKYIPVRLTDGKKFYKSIASAIAEVGISKLAQTNLENLEFENGKLKVDAEGEIPSNIDYTWTDGNLIQKVETYSDKVITYDYQWSNGNLVNKEITIT
jgi:hypothetical protein